MLGVAPIMVSGGSMGRTLETGAFSVLASPVLPGSRSSMTSRERWERATPHVDEPSLWGQFLGFTLTGPTLQDAFQRVILAQKARIDNLEAELRSRVEPHG